MSEDLTRENPNLFCTGYVEVITVKSEPHLNHALCNLPFGGDDCGLIKASGITTPKSKWFWLPVSAYLIEHPEGRILVDTGWHREMSPDGFYDRKAQIKSLGTIQLYMMNQGRIAKGEAIDEQ